MYWFHCFSIEQQQMGTHTLTSKPLGIKMVTLIFNLSSF